MRTLKRDKVVLGILTVCVLQACGPMPQGAPTQPTPEQLQTIRDVTELGAQLAGAACEAIGRGKSGFTRFLCRLAESVNRSSTVTTPSGVFVVVDVPDTESEAFRAEHQ